MMGLGQGLMPTKMRSSYNAGQQGLQDLVRAQQAGDYMKGRVGSATLEDLERELGAIRAKMGKARVSMPQGGQ
ncbi:hypothetical protein [Caudoviricetes sp.]|nr:hypothetical protein [Caudoviricetes sp.]